MLNDDDEIDEYFSEFSPSPGLNIEWHPEDEGHHDMALPSLSPMKFFVLFVLILSVFVFLITR